MVTAGPTFSTTPAASQPRISGKPDGNAPARLPSRIFVSTGLTPAAWLRMSTKSGRDRRRLDVRLVQRLGPAPLVDDHRVHQATLRTRRNTSAVSESTRSRNSRPSRWSISCCRQRASKPSERTRRRPRLDLDRASRGARWRSARGCSGSPRARPRRPRRATIRGLTSTSRPFELVALRCAGDVDDDDPHHLAQLRGRQPDAVPEGVHRVDEIRATRAISPAVVRLPRDLLERGVRVAEDLADHRGVT